MAKAMKKSMKSSMKKKAMKAKKASGMKKRAKRVSKVAKGKLRKLVVFRGNKEKTSGGLKKSDLIKNRRGRIVSRKMSARATKSKGFNKISKWGAAVKKARDALKIKGFCPVGGKSSQGKALLSKVRSLYK